MNKIFFLFIFISFLLNAGKNHINFPTAPTTFKECEAKKYLKRVLHRLNLNQTQKQELFYQLAKSTRDNNFISINEVLEALAVHNFVEQTMLLQARIGQGEVEQEESFLKRCNASHVYSNRDNDYSRTVVLKSK